MKESIKSGMILLAGNPAKLGSCGRNGYCSKCIKQAHPIRRLDMEDINKELTNSDDSHKESMPKAKFDPQEVTAKFKEILSNLTKSGDSTIDPKHRLVVDEIDLDDDFSKIGFTSVDFLEFVLSIEMEFDVDIPDELLVGAKLNSPRAWVDYLCGQQHKAPPPKTNG
jgi:acyl carrier protein